jgi:CBS-domain-containing membrane protein
MLMMREHQVRRIPVTDGEGRLVGILSQNELIDEAAREREGQRKELCAPAVMATLAGIGRSRAGELEVVAA